MPEQDSIHANKIYLLHLRIDLELWFLESIQLDQAPHVDVVVYFIPNQSLVQVKSLKAEFL